MVIPLPPPTPPFLPPDVQIRKDGLSQQSRIQLFLFISLFIYTVILILGRVRARGNSLMKTVSTNLFMVTAYLLSFIPGLMKAPGQSNDLYIFWIAFLAYMAAITNEVSCYTLSDNEDRKKRLIIDYAVVWPLILSTINQNLAAPEILVPVIIIFCIVVLKLRERSRALLYATNSTYGIARATKIISDFTKYEKESSAQNNNNPSFFPYNNFLVGIREAHKMVENRPNGPQSIDFDPSNSNVITLEKIFNPNETFLVSTNEGNELQNTCVSFGMFSVLLAKIAGYDHVDAKLFKIGNALPQNSFDLVEKELEFLYEYLFTNYYVIYERGFWKKIRDLCVISLFFWVTIPLLVEYRSQDHNVLYVVLWGNVLDTGFTRSVILAIILIDFIHIGIFMTSKWAKVMYTCAYLKNRSNLLQWVMKITCRVPRPKFSLFYFRKFSTRTIEQYSILNCYSAIPKQIWLSCWIGPYLELPRMGQAGNWDVTLPIEIKDMFRRAIDICLHQHEGKFTNGVRSLEENNAEEDIIRDYVKNVTSDVRIILIWHIATTLIEEDARETPPSYNYNNQDFNAASIISNYIAYLVAFFPQLLPDHVYTSQCEFDEAIRVLKAEKLEDDDGENPKEGLKGDNSVLGQARKLKEKLEQHPNLWKTLSEFWTEILLFLALGDHREAMEAHADSLCIGGAFITHIWALVTHAGCSRETINVTIDD